MNKKQRHWGLMGLLGLGGLMMMGASGGDDDAPGGDDPGGGPGGDDPGGGGPGGDDPGTNDGPGGNDAPGSDDPGTNDGPGGGTDPSGNDPDDDDDSDDDILEFPLPVFPPNPSPAPRPSPPTTTDPPRPPVSGNDDVDPIELPPPVFPPPVFPPADDGPPWSELVDPYPRGARFYLVVRGDRFGGTSTRHSIAYRFLLSEAYLAATEVGELEHEAALEWALAVGRQDKVRVQVIDLYQCSGWNDAMYGADPVRVSHASENGRSILLVPVHGPTSQRLAEGQTPLRNITMRGNPADTDLRHYELLWGPAINRTSLWDSGGSVITTTDMVWPDGSSMENPPPWVMELGIEDESEALEGSFGCPGSDGELEIEA